MGSALQSVKQFLNRVGVKLPWKYTGIVSTYEYQNDLPIATEYRSISPGSKGTKVSIPARSPDRVFDIKYYVHDVRHHKKRLPSEEEVKAHQEELKEWRPPTPGKPLGVHTRVHWLDYENNGYT